MTPNITIEEGNQVVLYESHQRMKLVSLKSGSIYNCKYGNFHHDDIIGKAFGQKIFTRTEFKGNKNRWIVALEPSPLLWNKVASHETEVLYFEDIGNILLNLDISRGDYVLEAGTGSGILSFYFASAIEPTGHLFSFDIEKSRVEKVRKDMDFHGLSDIVSINEGNITDNRFLELLEYPRKFAQEKVQMDAIFLDIPNPWDAIENCIKLLKDKKSICTFSPCIEQVQKTTMKMEKCEMYEIRTIKLINTFYESRYVKVGDQQVLRTRAYQDQIGHTGYLTIARKK